MNAEPPGFDEYFIAEYPKIVAELDYILGSIDLSRDVAQEAFARQYASWARLSRYDKPGAWARRVALRIAFQTCKLLFRTVDWDSVAEPPTAPHLPLSVTSAFGGSKLVTAVHNLKPNPNFSPSNFEVDTAGKKVNEQDGGFVAVNNDVSNAHFLAGAVERRLLRQYL